MAQYVVHKIGFFYTDECFIAEVEKGTVAGIAKSLEEAQAIKNREDIKSMKGVAGCNAVDFFFESPNYEKIYKELEVYYVSEFKTPIKEKDHFLLPKKIK